MNNHTTTHGIHAIIFEAQQSHHHRPTFVTFSDFAWNEITFQPIPYKGYAALITALIRGMKLEKESQSPNSL
jgi:hypothetical protein